MSQSTEHQSFQVTNTKVGTNVVYRHSEGWLPRLAINATAYKVAIDVYEGQTRVAHLIKPRGQSWGVVALHRSRASQMFDVATELGAEYNEFTL